MISLRSGASFNNISVRRKLAIGQELKIPTSTVNLDDIPINTDSLPAIEDDITSLDDNPSYKLEISADTNGDKYAELYQNMYQDSIPYIVPDGKTLVNYTIKRKDNLVDVADLYDVRVSDLRNWNNLPYTSRVKVSDTLKIYVDTAKVEYYAKIDQLSEKEKNELLFVNSKDTWVEHRIRNGESLSVIASKYGVTVSQLKDWNNLRSDRIRRGKKLLIYSGDIRNISSSSSIASNNGKKVVYRVKKGDSLIRIAEKFNVRVAQLRMWNDLTSDRIDYGQKLTIHGKDQTKSLGDNTTRTNSNIIRYTIKSNDTIGEIAEAFNVSVADLKKWNNLSTSRIYAGKSLKIYSDVNPTGTAEKLAEKTASKVKEENDDTDTHKIASGETLSEIAEKYNVGIKDLKEWNDLSSNKIVAGKKLYVEKPSGFKESSTGSNSKSKYHIVKEGESLWTISKNYRVLVSDLISWNNLKNDRVQIGQKLKVSK